MPEESKIPYTEYIHSLDEDAATTVMGWRLRAQELAGRVHESMTDGMPALLYQGQPLVSVVATKEGFSISPFSEDVVAVALPDLDGFATTKGEVSFTAAKPLPVAVFDRMVKERQAEIDAALGSSGGGRGR